MYINRKYLEALYQFGSGTVFFFLSRIGSGSDQHEPGSTTLPACSIYLPSDPSPEKYYKGEFSLLMVAWYDGFQI